jgi:thioredoxin reductase (NADPH)
MLAQKTAVLAASERWSSAMSARSAEIVDCLIIGGGPAGLTAATYLARFHLSTLVIDAGDGRAAAIPMTHNHSGFPEGISGLELLGRMRDQATKYGAVLEPGMVNSVSVADTGLFVVKTVDRTFSARTVLLATGVLNRRPMTMPLSQHDEAVACGLLRYCPICDGYEVTDRPVAVIGTGKTGLAEAQFLRSYTDKVSLISPEANHHLDTSELAEVRAAEIDLQLGPCLEFSLHSGSIRVRLQAKTLAFASIYPALGTTIRSELALSLGAQATGDGCPAIDSHQRTSIRGLYAAGDVVSGLDQISHAMGQAAVAATAIRNDLAAIRALQR